MHLKSPAIVHALETPLSLTVVPCAEVSLSIVPV